MMAMAKDRLAPRWRNFASWSGVGALFYLVVMAAIVSLLHEDGFSAMIRSREVALTVGLVLAST
ncbi:MAG TPA: hypothetical protein VM662_02130, partial [Sphingomonas sp.]|nr:hypothetical protein [Sphingomonas sp.]